MAYPQVNTTVAPEPPLLTDVHTLYPQGYHATGMPIKACADKLASEIALFGNMFDGYSEHGGDADPTPEAASPQQPRPKEDVTKFTNIKKSKYDV